MNIKKIVEAHEGKRPAYPYVRSSFFEQTGQNELIASEIGYIVGWYEKNDVVLLKVFCDFGASGSDHASRELDRVMAKATGSDRPHDTVTVQSLSRITHDPAFRAASYEPARAAGVVHVPVQYQ